MVKWEIVSKVYRAGIEWTDRYVQEFDENENVFGRVLIYHKRMEKVWNNAPFKLISANPIKEKRS